MSRRPRVLLIGSNYRYINPTNSLIPAALSKVFVTRFYGPGYVSQTVLQGGVERYIESLGGVDLVFASKDFCLGDGSGRLIRFLDRYTVMLNGGQVTAEAYADISAFLKRNRNRVVLLLTDLDPHSVPQAWLDSIEQHASYYVTWGAQFLNTLGDERWVAAEAYMQKKLQAGQPLGLLDEFAAREERHIISLGFFVSETEFYWGDLADRPYHACVPGSKYARRTYFLESLKQIPDLRIPRFWYKAAYQIAERFFLPPFCNFYLVHLYNLMFQRALSLSRCCVTDGGANNYPVRKFFEIPAAGALLVCPPATGMQALGFRANVNYIPVREPAEAVEVVKALAAEPERFEAMAAAGREQVFESHTLSARARQLELAVQRILAGTFCGSLWEDGRFTCADEAAVGRLAAASGNPSPILI
jgi:glycosyl transferase family 1